MKVHLLDLKAQYATIRAEVRAAIDRVCESQQFILGPEVNAPEQEIAALCGVGCGVGMSSGTDALLAALMGIGVGPGDEVITPTYSFFATAGVISRLGATPVFVDIDPRTYNLDTEATLARITPRTKAVVAVHLVRSVRRSGPDNGGRSCPRDHSHRGRGASSRVSRFETVLTLSSSQSSP
jgi:dTDP-4-amino-4,6-dideoxygalactose transaminase